MEKNTTSSTKPEVLIIAMPPEENRATAAGNTRIKFGDVWTSDSRGMLADRQTDRQTDTLDAILCSRTWGVINMSQQLCITAVKEGTSSG